MLTELVTGVVICSAVMGAEARESPEVVVERVSAAVDPARLRTIVDRLAGFGTRHTMSETESETRGIGAARRWAKGEMESYGGRLEVSLDPHVVMGAGGRLPEGAEVVNVVAVLPGVMPEAAGRRYYAVGHLDSRNSDGADAAGDAPGANDDGSGVALLMELARVLADEPLDATVVFLATSGEEQGLYGARLHARAQAEAGVDVRAVLNNDTVGDPSGVNGREARHEIRVFSEGLDYSLLQPMEGQEGDAAAADEARVAALKRVRLYGMENDGASRQLARFIAEVAERHGTAVRPRLVARPDRFLRGGDHTPFNELGIAAVRFCEVYENYDRQHQDVRAEDGVQYGDLPEHVDEAYLADVTRLNAAVVIHLANAPSVPGNVRIITASLANDTTLRWEASPEPDVAGYEVVWRETMSPAWTESRDVGNVTEATIELSKDNWFFGVRAYDRQGYRSPVAFPVAAGR